MHGQKNIKLVQIVWKNDTSLALKRKVFYLKFSLRQIVGILKTVPVTMRISMSLWDATPCALIHVYCIICCSYQKTLILNISLCFYEFEFSKIRYVLLFGIGKTM